MDIDLDTLDSLLSAQITISEMFGPTLQGEGPSLGRPAMFVRLGLCNLDCRWCDTPFTWDWTGKNGTKYDKKQELRRTTVGDVIANVCQPGLPRRIVISGGEPLVQAKAVCALAMAVAYNNEYTVEVETNGTLEPPLEVANLVHWNVSPKLAGSGVDSRRNNPDVLRLFAQTRSHAFKYVIANDDDMTEALRQVRTCDIDPKNVYLMPEGRTAQEINDRLPKLFEWAANVGWNVTTRLHVLAFGDKRGV